MTTYDDVMRSAEDARNAAVQTLDAVRVKALLIAARPILWGAKTEAEGMLTNAAMNVATIELLPEILDDALASQDVGTALAQAMVVIEQTRDSTIKYATWAEASAVAAFAREVWAVFVELVADLAYEVADAVIVIGERAISGVGIGGAVAVLAVLGIVGFITTR